MRQGAVPTDAFSESSIAVRKPFGCTRESPEQGWARRQEVQGADAVTECWERC